MRTDIGQQMIIGLAGPSLTSEEKKFIVDNNIGGVILFDRNVKEPQQIHALCQELQSLRTQMKDRAPLFISIDMEGGRVHRLKSPFTKWPAVRKLGDLDSPSKAFDFAFAMGTELRAVGINLDFAPCVDIFTNPRNTVIGDRSPGTQADVVAKHGSALVRGYIKAGVIPCAKHFPGHGNTVIDSHEDLPRETTSLEELRQREMEPFRKVFKSRLDLLMTAHIHFTAVDPEWPVTLSEVFLKKILREELRYRGLIISDDLDMKALALHYPKAQIPVRALQAGCNILLYCNEPSSPPFGLDAIEQALSDGSLARDVIVENAKRVLELKKDMLANPEPLPWEEARTWVGHPDHHQLAKEIGG